MLVRKLVSVTEKSVFGNLRTFSSTTRVKMYSVFSSTEPVTPTDMLKVRQGYLDDKSPNKVDLGVGAYRTEEGQPWVLPTVQRIEVEMANDKSANHEYLMFLGNDSYREAAMKLLLGKENVEALGKRAFGVQSIGGTGSLRIGAEFLSRILKYNTVYLSKPTWDNHRPLFSFAGFTDIREYRYWDPVHRTLDINGLLEDLRHAPPKSIVVLHACAHNPTGCDPNHDQWAQIADVVKEKEMFPFFDSAYQGFATGDLEGDAWAVRYFVERGFELFCAQSFSKSAGLYNERIGNLTVVLNDTSSLSHLQTHLAILVRGMYCNPANHGMKIMNRILNDPELFEEWKKNIITMANRVLVTRKALRKQLENLKTPGTWNHITDQIGMFSYTGLTEKQVEFMRNERHIYLLKTGRINMCGLNPKNTAYVAQAIHDAIVQIQD